MFLSSRTAQAEYFDSVRPVSEVAAFFDSLNRFNRLFLFAEPFQRDFPKFFGAQHCKSMSILDVGAGDGSLGKTLSSWANEREWDWRVTNLDQNPASLALTPGGKNVVGSATALPFPDRSFDVVISCQMAHHLSGDDVVRHLAEAWRVSRSGIFISDLHRNFGLYVLLWLVLRLRKHPRSFYDDALLSVKRAWRVGEMKQIAARAALPAPRVNLYYGARILVKARKHT